jgi:integrase
MSTFNSTKLTVASKPERPEGSPLFWHKSGRWCKKIRGRFAYFGRGSHDEALAEYKHQAADLHSGREPKKETKALTVSMLCTAFLKAKKERRDNGELTPRSFLEYVKVCRRLTKVFGKSRLVSDLGQKDWSKLRAVMAKNWCPKTLHDEIVRTKVPFNWASKMGLLETPMKFGEAFNPPSQKTLRKHKAAQGPRMFEAEEVRRMIEAARQPLKSIILLGINCGYSNSDIGALSFKALDLEKGLATFARVKTGIMRRCPLWPETVESLRAWLAIRPEPKHQKDAELVFLTRNKNGWAPDGIQNPICLEMKKLVERLGIDKGRVRRPTFYDLRHTLQTIGDECGDFLAVRHIMGHASNDIADTYRERMSDARLSKVANHVRAWVFVGENQGEDSEPDVVKFRQAK